MNLVTLITKEHVERSDSSAVRLAPTQNKDFVTTRHPLQVVLVPEPLWSIWPPICATACHRDSSSRLGLDLVRLFEPALHVRPGCDHLVLARPLGRDARRDRDERDVDVAAPKGWDRVARGESRGRDGTVAEGGRRRSDGGEKLRRRCGHARSAPEDIVCEV